jgi:hypothetical protein
MKNDLAQIFLDEARRLELIVAELYTLLAKLFPEDHDFWHQLAQEEKDHAALIDAIGANPNLSKKFVSSSAPDLLREIQEINEWLSLLKVEFSEGKPDRKTVFDTAVKIEKSAGEINYQSFMTKQTDSWILIGLQHITKYDLDHLERLEKYMKENNIL